MSALAVDYLKLKNLQPYYPKPVETLKVTEEKTENTTIIKPETETKKDE